MNFIGFILFLAFVVFVIYKTLPDDIPVKKVAVVIVGAAMWFWEKIQPRLADLLAGFGQ